jgi:hypothetical protein
LIDEGYDVATFDYRGFFDSPERNQQFPINPATTKRDSIDFLRYLQNNYRGSTLVLFGISLGSINSLLAAAQSVKDNKQVKGLILDSAFGSYVGLGREHIRRFFLPFQFVADVLLDDAFAPTNSECQSLSGIPRLFVHATGDPIVPYSCGKKCQDRTGREHATFIKVSGSWNHANNFNEKEVREHILRWLQHRSTGQTYFDGQDIQLGQPNSVLFTKTVAKGVFFVTAVCVGVSCFLIEKAIETAWFTSLGIVIIAYDLGKGRLYPGSDELQRNFQNCTEFVQNKYIEILLLSRRGFKWIEDMVKDDLGSWFYR